MFADWPAAERANKKAEVIAMMKRTKGAALAEIMGVTEWQAPGRGFVSILRSKEGLRIESNRGMSQAIWHGRNLPAGCVF